MDFVNHIQWIRSLLQALVSITSILVPIAGRLRYARVACKGSAGGLGGGAETHRNEAVWRRGQR
jgi:hypothetical protein